MDEEGDAPGAESAARIGPDAVDFAVKERAMDEAPVGIVITDPDREDNPLVYVNETFERVTGYSAAESVGRNCRFLQGEETDPDDVARLRELVDSGEAGTVELLNYRADGESFWNEVTLAPLRDEDGEITNFVGFQSDVTRRVEAERALAGERERLDRLLDHVEGLLETVTETILAAPSRDALTAGVCERLAAMDEYVGAWIGEPDAAREVVAPVASAGDVGPASFGGPGEDDVPLDADHPAAVALATGEVQTRDAPQGGPGDGATDTDDGATDTDDGTPGTDDGTPGTDDGRPRSLVAVPLVYREDVTGVLTVLAPERAAFDEREVTVFRALGRSIGSALSVLQSRRILASDEVVDVTLELTDDDLFVVHVASEADCRLEYAGAVQRSGGSALFFTATGAEPERVLAAAEAADDLASASLLAATDDECRLEVLPVEDHLVGGLAEFGAETRSIVAAEGTARLTARLPAGGDVRALFERIAERHPGTSLLSTQTRERPPTTKTEFLDEVDERLTDRQRTALRTAFVGGYFDRPRAVDGDDLAEAMGVTRSTFHQHLRSAERKLLSSFFER